MKTQTMKMWDLIDELNFEAQDAAYQTTIATSKEELDEIKDGFVAYLEKFAQKVNELYDYLKKTAIDYMKEACEMFLQLYKINNRKFA